MTNQIPDGTELLACPFCGNNNLKSGGDDKVVGVCCLVCEATGPNHYGKIDWNTRSAALPEQAGPSREERHYLNSIRVRLEALYNAFKNNSRLREQLSDEVDWIDARLATKPADGGVREIIAYEYELATCRDESSGEYSGWVRRLTWDKAIVPAGSIRGMRALVALQQNPKLEDVAAMHASGRTKAGNDIGGI